jgi:MFS family permease
LLEIVPTFGKTEAFSVYASMTNLAAFIGNLLSGFLFVLFASIHFNLSLWVIDAYRLVFIVSILSSIWTLTIVLKVKTNIKS